MGLNCVFKTPSYLIVEAQASISCNLCKEFELNIYDVLLAKSQCYAAGLKQAPFSHLHTPKQATPNIFYLFLSLFLWQQVLQNIITSAFDLDQTLKSGHGLYIVLLTFFFFNCIDGVGSLFGYILNMRID